MPLSMDSATRRARRRSLVKTYATRPYSVSGLNQGVVSNPAAPFGRTKQSGLGPEGGHTGIEESLETKYIGIALS